MTEPRFVEYKLHRRAATDQRSYFVVTFVRPDDCDSEGFVNASCKAFHEIMAENNLEYFVLGDPHLECNLGAEFTTDDSKWKAKFDDTFVPGETLYDMVLGNYDNGPELSFSFHGPRGVAERFFDPEGDYSNPDPDPEWYCEGRYSEE